MSSKQKSPSDKALCLVNRKVRVTIAVEKNKWWIRTRRPPRIGSVSREQKERIVEAEFFESYTLRLVSKKKKKRFVLLGELI